MAKYSTGNSSSSGGDACELCGAETSNLRTANVAGAELQVCSNCASHGETKRTEKRRTGGGGGGNLSEQERKRRAAQNAARMSDRAKGSTKHWEEEGTHYDDDPLPYLVKGYGGQVTAAREEAELTTAELADELDIREKDLQAVEAGRASSQDVGGSVIEALEERFDLRLAE